MRKLTDTDKSGRRKLASWQRHVHFTCSALLWTTGLVNKFRLELWSVQLCYAVVCLVLNCWCSIVKQHLREFEHCESDNRLEFYDNTAATLSCKLQTRLKDCSRHILATKRSKVTIISIFGREISWLTRIKPRCIRTVFKLGILCALIYIRTIMVSVNIAWSSLLYGSLV